MSDLQSPDGKPLDEAFWTERYRTGATGWDIGNPSTPLTDFIDALTDKDQRILIPGGGNAYEAEYLHRKGFGNVFVLDISRLPLNNLLERVPDFPEEHLIHADFFDHAPSRRDRYDLILEQTFFCALDPALRTRYAGHMFSLLKAGGRLAGLLFDVPLDDTQELPPFGGSVEEYRGLFSAFGITTMEACRNSIGPRLGRELFFILQKPDS